MRIAKSLAVLAVALSVSSLATADEKSIPDPSVLLAKMDMAHGGKSNWLNTPAFKFSTAMHLMSLKPKDGRTWSDSWRYYEVTLDPDTSRAYVDLPHEARPGYEAGFDGTSLWRTEYSFDPNFQDGAMMLAWYHSSIIALPFLVDAEGASLSYSGMEELPDRSGKFHVVNIDYAPTGWNGEYDIFLDPESGLLTGWRQGAMTPPLPGSPVDALPSPPGTVTRVVDEFQKVGTFTVPRKYVSYGPRGKMAGIHMVLTAEILDGFDAHSAAPPDGAAISYKKP